MAGILEHFHLTSVPKQRQGREKQQSSKFFLALCRILMGCWRNRLEFLKLLESGTISLSESFRCCKSILVHFQRQELPFGFCHSPRGSARMIFSNSAIGSSEGSLSFRKHLRISPTYSLSSSGSQHEIGTDHLKRRGKIILGRFTPFLLIHTSKEFFCTFYRLFAFFVMLSILIWLSFVL